MLWRLLGGLSKVFLITGFGASGTKYTATIFQKLGYDVGHEKDGKDGVVSWKHLTKHENYGIILHQVRHPLKVLGSAVTGRNSSLEYILSNFDDVPYVYEDKLHTVMYAYVMWTEWADRVSHYKYRVEDFETEYKVIFELLGLDVPKRLPAVPKNFNSHSHKDTYMKVTVDDLYERDSILARDIMDILLIEGYEV
jgi:hypothetical protein